ncbi:protein SGT1 homolog [Zootermopsis nevadensis]|uniref:Suppressor of G2 allele of SKP1-like protein n=1 Tax=Zootermopsis nevadensis TaxID=136037 RepID=A0A067QZR9_ZOONE|nr:protein SGT1 homolog [Zootermopsis nevadensis]KDR16057.1 Suppressor of G2 allele of SKP1-like protein [Zootermopsis nevadensis]
MADSSNPQSAGEVEEIAKQVPKIKHDWYQTESHVVITILAKNVKQDEVKVEFAEEALNVAAQLTDGSEYHLNLNLPFPVIPGQSTFRVIPSKIEIKLKKHDGIRWASLEADPTTSEVAQPMPEAVLSAGPPKYPSSAPKATDWDRIVGDITKQEGDEKPEGDAALNALFQKIYSQGSDEVKRAMNKSFQESGGTVLSTNWNEVAREKVEVKAPDGMEWHKWEQ